MSALFDYPSKTQFGRIVAKNKIYERVKPSRKIQDTFAAQVGKIIWQYKLAPETTNLPSRPGVQEIEVFEIPLKTDDLDTNILRCIDKSIIHPIIYNLTFENRIKVIATYKRPNEADSSKWVVGDAYFSTDWLPADTERQKLPIVLDLAGLYEHILREIISVPSRDGESLAKHISRMELLIAKEKEHKKLESRMDKENQFNRKVELNGQLKMLADEIESLRS
jgi:hypothetical protein